MKILVVLILLITSITPPSYAQEKCAGVFSRSLSVEDYVQQTGIKSITTEEIMTLALTDLRTSRLGISEKIEQWFKRQFDIFIINKSYHQTLMNDIKRRDYTSAFKRLGVEVKEDPQTLLLAKRKYFSLIFSLFANGAVNGLAYKYLGTTGIIVHIPHLPRWSPENIPLNVLKEILTRPTPGPLLKEYIKARFRHGADLILNNLTTLLNGAILVAIITQAQAMILNPEEAIASELEETQMALLQNALEKTNHNIALVQQKLSAYEQEGNVAKVAYGKELMIKLQNERNDILTSINNRSIK